jgi:putative transposase
MNLVKQIKITKSSPFFKECDEICFKSKNLYNQALYRVKSAYESKKEYINYHKLYKILADENQTDYRALPQNVACQTLMLLERNYKSYFELLKSDKKLSGIPKPPKFLHKTQGRLISTYTQRVIRKKYFDKGFINLTNTNLMIPIDLNYIKYDDVQQISIIPKENHYIISINYKKQEKNKLENDNYCGVDMGLNNLITTGFNTPENKPLIINGKPVKSINQFYNKKRSKLQKQLSYQKRKTSKRLKRLTKKRNDKIKDYLHKASRKFVNYCLKYKISNVVIGKNKNWKSEINIGKKNNQNFVSVPHNNLITYIRYKCELEGITVIEREESYTSKCSFFDGETIRKHNEYAGVRIKRGLFKTARHKLVNADLNGAYNILKKEFPNCFTYGIEGLLVSPISITV